MATLPERLRWAEYALTNSRGLRSGGRKASVERALAEAGRARGERGRRTRGRCRGERQGRRMRGMETGPEGSRARENSEGIAVLFTRAFFGSQPFTDEIRRLLFSADVAIPCLKNRN
jgi:hypothetical protein